MCLRSVGPASMFWRVPSAPPPPPAPPPTETPVNVAVPTPIWWANAVGDHARAGRVPPWSNSHLNVMLVHTCLPDAILVLQFELDRGHGH